MTTHTQATDFGNQMPTPGAWQFWHRGAGAIRCALCQRPAAYPALASR